MTTTQPVAEAAPSSFRRKQRLGFNTRVSFSDDRGPRQGLRDGVELFTAAEALGYQSGWVYQRHFDHYLSSPLPFLAAVGQHTHRITLGTAVLPMRYQDPILLAEAAGTTDLLVGGTASNSPSPPGPTPPSTRSSAPSTPTPGRRPNAVSCGSSRPSAARPCTPWTGPARALRWAPS